MTCQMLECQTTAGCAHRGPQGQMCWFPGVQTLAPFSPPMGCICPPGANLECQNPMCPRKGFRISDTTPANLGSLGSKP